MRFDWYQPTLPDTPQVIISELLGRLAGPGGEVIEGPGRFSYRQSFTVQTRARDRVAVVLCGGSNGDPNVTASGVACDAFVPFVRELWPEHRLTRVDVAEDFIGEGVYEQLEARCMAVIRDTGRVKGRRIVPDQLADGRTYYMGSPKSDTQSRLYDKTAELRMHLPLSRHAEIPDHLVRLELQVRPRKTLKDVACRMPPTQFWGCAEWSRDVAAAAMELAVEKVRLNPARESDHDRSYRALLQQYGRTLRRMWNDHGSWSAVGAQIGHDLERLGKSDE